MARPLAFRWGRTGQEKDSIRHFRISFLKNKTLDPKPNKCKYTRMDKNFRVLILTAWAQAVPQFWLAPQMAMIGFGIWTKRDQVRLLATYFCWWDITSKRVVYGHTTLNTPDLVKEGQVWTRRPAQWLANVPVLKKNTPPNQTHPQNKCDTLG